MKRYKNLIRLLNLNYLRLTNKTISSGSKDLPAISCNVTVFPDHIALYSEKSLYHKTDRTAVAFFQYDEDFDDENGLFAAIYYDIEDRLSYFKERFKDVKYAIIPDFSELGDIQKIEDDYRLFKGRVIGLWFMFDIGAVVIPNITFPTEESVDFALDGYEDSSVAAISTKGHMSDPAEKQRLRTNIRLAIEKLPNLKTFIVYDVCATNDATLEIFSYAIEKGIEVIIPDNTLKERNMLLHRERQAHRKSVIL